MNICTLFSEELTKALVEHLQDQFQFIAPHITQTRVPRTDSIEYQFEVDVSGYTPDDNTCARMKIGTAHFIRGYIAGLSQCESIVKGEGEWEHDAVQASADNLP
jgi:hypothetical protein